MRIKSETFEYFKKFHKHDDAHTGRKLKVLRTDNGGEYLSNDFRAYLSSYSINPHLTVAMIPQQNGVAERVNRTLLGLVLAIMHHRGVGKRFWAEALSTDVYMRNRVTSNSLSVDTRLHHIWVGPPPNVSLMRVFGSRCWYVIPSSNVRKLDSRSKEAMTVCYASQSKLL
jgi:transposase InsO family protein